MLRKTDASGQAAKITGRIVPLDRARTFVTLLVLLYHSVGNYAYFGSGDQMRWLGFDLVVLFTDSFFMALMFFISGLFVWDSLRRNGAVRFLRDQALRLGVPFLVSIFVLVPVAYYPTFLRYHWPGTTDFNFLHFWWRTLTIGPWPSGPAWFLWVLLVLDAMAVAVWVFAHRVVEAFGRLTFAARHRPMLAFAMFLLVSVAAYLPMQLAFGDGSWLELGRFPISIQTSRMLLYPTYFFVGVGIGAAGLREGLLAEGGELAKRWLVWLALAMVFYGAILGLVYVRHNWVADFNSPLLPWRVGYGLAFAMFSAAMAFAVPGILLRFAKANWGLLDALQPSAYGIYLLHYIFITWLQYAVYDPPLPAVAKFAIVFAGAVSMSWALTVTLRKIPVVARTI